MSDIRPSLDYRPMLEGDRILVSEKIEGRIDVCVLDLGTVYQGQSRGRCRFCFDVREEKWLESEVYNLRKDERLLALSSDPTVIAHLLPYADGWRELVNLSHMNLNETECNILPYPWDYPWKKYEMVLGVEHLWHVKQMDFLAVYTICGAYYGRCFRKLFPDQDDMTVYLSKDTHHTSCDLIEVVTLIDNMTSLERSKRIFAHVVDVKPNEQCHCYDVECRENIADDLYDKFVCDTTGCNRLIIARFFENGDYLHYFHGGRMTQVSLDSPYGPIYCFLRLGIGKTVDRMPVVDVMTFSNGQVKYLVACEDLDEYENALIVNGDDIFDELGLSSVMGMASQGKTRLADRKRRRRFADNDDEKHVPEDERNHARDFVFVWSSIFSMPPDQVANLVRNVLAQQPISDQIYIDTILRHEIDGESFAILRQLFDLMSGSSGYTGDERKSTETNATIQSNMSETLVAVEYSPGPNRNAETCRSAPPDDQIYKPSPLLGLDAKESGPTKNVLDWSTERVINWIRNIHRRSAFAKNMIKTVRLLDIEGQAFFNLDVALLFNLKSGPRRGLAKSIATRKEQNDENFSDVQPLVGDWNDVMWSCVDKFIELGFSRRTSEFLTRIVCDRYFANDNDGLCWTVNLFMLLWERWKEKIFKNSQQANSFWMRELRKRDTGVFEGSKDGMMMLSARKPVFLNTADHTASLTKCNDLENGGLM